MSLVIDVRVVPKSGRQACKLDNAGRLKCYLKSPPEKGLANKELIKYLAKAINSTQRDIEIIAGATDRNKRIRIDVRITFEQLLAKLGIERQQLLFEDS